MTSRNAGHPHVRGRCGWPHDGSSPHPLTLSRLRHGPAMTPDYRPSLVRSFERHLRAENRSVTPSPATWSASAKPRRSWPAAAGASWTPAARTWRPSSANYSAPDAGNRRHPLPATARVVPMAGGGRGDPGQPHGANEATDRARPARPVVPEDGLRGLTVAMAEARRNGHALRSSGWRPRTEWSEQRSSHRRRMRSPPRPAAHRLGGSQAGRTYG